MYSLRDETTPTSPAKFFTPIDSVNESENDCLVKRALVTSAAIHRVGNHDQFLIGVSSDPWPLAELENNLSSFRNMASSASAIINLL